MLDIRTLTIPLVVVLAAACTHDYDTFEGTPAAAGSAGTGAGGSPSDAGPDSSSGGAAGAMPEASPDAPGPDTGCSSTQKLCGDTCVSVDDVATGCASPACDPCNLPHADVVCASGLCSIAACQADFGDCNGDAQDGCETNVSTDESNCGTCATACAGSLSCSHGVCECTKNPDCSAGSNGTCNGQGRCVCGGTTCQPGERCGAQGDCQL